MSDERPDGLRTRGSEWFAPDRDVEVLPDAVSEVELELRPATGRLIELRVPDGAQAARVDMLVRDERGELVCHYRGAALRGDAVRLSVGGLTPGSYALEARTEGGLSTAASFGVADLAPVAEPIVFDLR